MCCQTQGTRDPARPSRNLRKRRAAGGQPTTSAVSGTFAKGADIALCLGLWDTAPVDDSCGLRAPFMLLHAPVRDLCATQLRDERHWPL